MKLNEKQNKHVLQIRRPNYKTERKTEQTRSPNQETMKLNEKQNKHVLQIRRLNYKTERETEQTHSLNL